MSKPLLIINYKLIRCHFKTIIFVKALLTKHGLKTTAVFLDVLYFTNDHSDHKGSYGGVSAEGEDVFGYIVSILLP